MNTETKGTNPLPKKIGLCLSGGGYRAAGYHLGTLDYLEHLGLLPNVTMLSTVSGGTFTGTAYAISLVEKEPFNVFFDKGYRFFRDSRYIENLFKYLGKERKDDAAINREHGAIKRMNFIEAAAEVYSSSFLKDEKTGRPYLFGKILDADIPLEVIFNTTSFYSGESFFFRKGIKTADLVGSEEVHISRDDARHIRLGDIAAASSCFPGGFEPLAFPHNFIWPGNKLPELQQYFIFGTQKIPPDKAIPLMDGGVADNVGLNGIINALPDGKDDLDLIIASDVDPKPIDLYKDFPLKPGASSFFQKESRIRLTMGSFNGLMMAVVLLLALTMVGQGIYTWLEFHGDGFRISSLYFYVVAFLLSTVVAGGLLWVRRMFRKSLLDWFDEEIVRGRRRSWDTFKHFTLGEAINMVKVRISSLYAMTNSVFMRCIRELTYDIVRQNPEYEKKLITDMIYYVKDQKNNMFFRQNFSPQPSRKLLDVVDAVVDMDSTLWWEEDYQLPCLVACAQISLCISLFNHYNDQKESNKEVKELLDKLHDDWKKLNNNPYVFLEKRYPDLKPFPLPPAVDQE